MRTLVLGLDGACLPVLERVFQRDGAPGLETLVGRGYAGELQSGIPPWTPSAWPTLFTGTNPGRHGVYGFLEFDGYDWGVADRSSVQEYALWEILDDHDYTSVVVNVPMTHPPREIDGAVVPGYIGPDDPECVPADALEAVRAELGEYSIYPPKGDHVTREEHVAACRDLARSRGVAFRTLADRFDPEFGFLQFQVTDTVFHEHPSEWDAVTSIYEAVDEQITAVLEACQPRNVLVVSDHGMGEYTGVEFRINDFLRDRGYIETRRDGEGMPSFDAIERNELRTDDGGGADTGVLTRLARTAARFGVTSQRLQRVLSPLGLDEWVAAQVPTDAVRAATERVDFANSTAYCRSRIELGVRINLEGREPAGVVPRSDYERVRETLVQELRAVRTPDGEPVFELVAPREEVFGGPRLTDAPDVVTIPAEFDHFLSGTLHGEQFGSPSEPWNHKRDGLLVAVGDDLATDAMSGAERAHILDVAPTVLGTFDITPTDRMDGRALGLVEARASEPYQQFEPAESDSTRGETVEQHLSHLGYLEDV